MTPETLHIKKDISQELSLSFLFLVRKEILPGRRSWLPGLRRISRSRKNTRGFEFGLCVVPGAGQNSRTDGSQKEYLATMFDAQEVVKGKLIKVWRQSGAHKASIVLTDGTEQPLINTRTVHYREQDRVSSKTKINWAVEFFGSVANIASTAVTAATGGQ